MKQALIMLTLIAALTGVLLFCNRNGNTGEPEAICSDKLYYLDAVDDSLLDTFVVGYNETNPSIRDISIIKEGKKNRIISIEPYGDSAFVLTQPQVETVHLAANNIQTDRKGLRIVIRNTDFIPDYLLIDLYYKDTWIIEKYILLNTNTDKQLFIKHADINKPVSAEYGEELICNPHLDIYEYFENTWTDSL
jgi:hypothetical protein